MIRTDDIRVAHSRFYKGHPSKKGYSFDRVVTSVWSIQPTDNEEFFELKYGATVWTKDSKSDHWVKNTHKKTAQERYNTKPVVVYLHSYWLRLKDIHPVSVDWLIATELIFNPSFSNVKLVVAGFG